MISLVSASIAFTALHRIVSGSSARLSFVQHLGPKIYQGAFATASAGCLTWLWFGYQSAKASGWNDHLYIPPHLLTALQYPIQFLAIVLVVLGLTTQNPTIATMDELARNPHIVKGALRITRHPFLWGIAIFSLGHILVRPTPAALVFFGTLSFLAISGTFSIDAKRRATLGSDYENFVSKTSNLPFAAIAADRQRLAIGELLTWKTLVGFIAFLSIAVSHPPEAF